MSAILPFELIVHIAETDIDTFRQMVKSYPKFAAYVTYRKDYYLNLFTKKHIEHDYIRTVACHRLPNKLLHGIYETKLRNNLGTIVYNYYCGEKHGKYYAILNGRKYTSNFVHGLQQGTNMAYLPDNTLISSTQYNNNLRNGLHLRYYKTGSIKSSTSYKDDLKHGPEIKYDKNGTIIKESNYYNGVIVY